MSKWYIMVPFEAALDTDLTHADTRVLMVLGAYTNEYQDAWPSQETLATATGMTRQTVCKSLAILESKGFITSGRLNEDAGGRRKKYRVNFPSCPRDRIVTSNVGLGLRSTSSQPDIQRKPRPTLQYKEDAKKKNKKTNDKKSCELGDLWAVYNDIAARAKWVVSRKLTDKAKSTLKARVSERGHHGVTAFWDELAREDWTRKGQGKPEDFKANFEYCVRPSTFEKHFDKLMDRRERRERALQREAVGSRRGEPTQTEPVQDGLPLVRTNEEEKQGPVPKRDRQHDDDAVPLSSLRRERRS